jgi:site-specific DNA-methyltransferase (adenine-specific)
MKTEKDKYEILIGDCIESMRTMEAGSVNCCVTSPPYFGLRDYGHDGQIGLEDTPDAFVARLVEVFREVKRVLRDDGTLWLNLGDSYAGSGKGRNADGTHSIGGKQDTNAGSNEGKGFKATTPDHKPKDLIGIPWRVAFALQADGWYLRQDIIWHKPNPMPESVRDRCTKAHEYIFLLSKSPKYYYDNEAIKEDAQNWGTRDRSAGKYTSGDVPISGGAHKGLQGKDDEENPTRNKRSVWTVTTQPYKGAHFATFPPDLIRPCIKAGCPDGGVVLDPFGGSGTTAAVAIEEGKKAVICELNPEYVGLAEERINAACERIERETAQTTLTL